MGGSRMIKDKPTIAAGALSSETYA